MSVFSFFPSEDAFWEAFSTIDKQSHKKRRLQWRELCKKTQEFRQKRDKEDEIRARAEYSDPSKFAEHFSYRKGSKTVLMTKSDAIARKYRALKGELCPWDQ